MASTKGKVIQYGPFHGVVVRNTFLESHAEESEGDDFGPTPWNRSTTEPSDYSSPAVAQCRGAPRLFHRGGPQGTTTPPTSAARSNTSNSSWPRSSSVTSGVHLITPKSTEINSDSDLETDPAYVWTRLSTEEERAELVHAALPHRQPVVELPTSGIGNGYTAPTTPPNGGKPSSSIGPPPGMWPSSTAAPPVAGSWKAAEMMRTPDAGGGAAAALSTTPMQRGSYQHGASALATAPVQQNVWSPPRGDSVEQLQRAIADLSPNRDVSERLLGSDPRGRHLLDLSRLARGSDLPLDISEEASVRAIKEMTCSITLADPSLPDCPLIGCSDAFETLTGYQRCEIIGYNCRFLNQGLQLDPGVRNRLRAAIYSDQHFSDVVPNYRRSGERFHNFLHLTRLSVRGKQYVVGIQADVTHIKTDLHKARPQQAIAEVMDRIFAANIDAWVQIQAREFSMRLPMAYSLRMKTVDSDYYEQNKETFVRQISDDRADLLKTEASTVVDSASSCDLDFNFNSLMWEADSGNNGDTRVVPLPKPLPTSFSEAPRQRPPSAVSAMTVPAVELEREINQGVQVKNRPPSATAPESSDNPAGAPTVVWSKGSADHPDGCTECSFYFFGPDGCRAGADCKFCHAFHPRRNPKKNRRIVRRIAATKGPGQAEVIETQAADTANSPVLSASEVSCVAAAPLPENDTPKPGKPLNSTMQPRIADEGLNGKGTSSSSTLQPRIAGEGELSGGKPKSSTMQPCIADEGTAVMEAMESDAKAFNDVDVTSAPVVIKDKQAAPTIGNPKQYALTISYPRLEGEDNQYKVTLAKGVRTRLHLETTFDTEEKKAALQGILSFCAEPALPVGLTLDGKTGQVSGIPTEAQTHTSYLICATTVAVGPGDFPLGSITLSCCKLVIEVIDMEKLTLRGGHSVENGWCLSFEC